MKKWIIILLAMLLVSQIVTALDECKNIVDSGDIPCLLISSWNHENSCSSYSAQVYKENTTLLDIRTLGAYLPLTWCNITFNYTEIGTYTINFTDGDVAIITVEADEMNYITIGIILAMVTFIFAYLSTKAKHWTFQIALSLITMVMVVFDFFISARIIEIADSAQTGMIHYLDTFFFIGVTIFRFALAGTVIFLIYYMYKHIIVSPLKRRADREDDELYG